MTTNRMPEITAWVGIGASAGGLESLRRVIRSLPMDTGATFVIIQHVSPHHKSLLSALLARETELSVSEIENGVVPLPNAVYVAPPNNDVVMSGGRLQLHKTEGQANHARPSVDRFFRSLAEAVGGRAVGVVLSGTGRDGAYGVQAIRAAGGVTVAQTETTAKYYGMPSAAIETGCVDLVLSPEDLGRKLSKIICLPRDLSDVAYVEETRDSYLLLLQLLYSQCQIDFRQYKQSSIRRRVERRITALGMDGIEPYLEYARSTTSELEALLKDLLISVTSFFRDPQEFDALAKELAQSEFVESTRGLRVWVPGCATGEEAYSIAILLGEAFGGPEKLADAQVQIFATDIDAEALAVARIGTYPDAAFDQVSREQVEQYFNSTVGGYSAKSFLREKITFTQHNLCEDPPFSNIDLISCRNVLIYLGDETQERVLARLHYSLRLDGLLFLGKSEAPVKAPGQFRQADATARIYKRLSTKTADRLGKPVSYGTRANTIGPAPQKETEQDPAPTQMFDALVRILGLPAMVVTESYSILRVYGELDSFITLSEGIVSGVTLAMLRDTYRSDALQLVALALRNGELRTGIDRPCPDDAEMSIRIKAYPIAIEAAAERMVLVCFERRKLGVQKLATPSSQEIQDFDELRRELESTSNSLQQTVEELETTNEELQALNEELQSSNEELQSTNEELDTANEELQSTNEELITVNEELQINSQELSLINQELDSILANIAAPILVVTKGLHIVRCSQSARDLFRINPAIGRPHLSQCVRPDGFPSLTELADDVIRLGETRHLDFETLTGMGQILAAPYFDPKGDLAGATAIVTNMSQVDARREVDALIDGIGMMVWNKDKDNRIASLNAAAAGFLGLTPQDAIGLDMAEVLPALGTGASELEESAVETMESHFGRIEKVTRADGSSAWLNISRIPFENANGHRSLYLVARDISAEYQSRIDRGRRHAMMSSVVDHVPVGIEYIDRDEKVLFRNLSAEKMGKADTTLGRSVSNLHRANRPGAQALATGSVAATQLDLHDANGKPKSVFAIANPVHSEGGDVDGAVVAYVDTDRLPSFSSKEGRSQRDPARGLPIPIWTWDPNSDAVSFSPRLLDMLGMASSDCPQLFSDMAGLIHNEDLNSLRSGLTAFGNSAEPVNLVYRARHRSGHFVHLQGIGHVVHDDAQQVTQLVVTVSRFGEDSSTTRIAPVAAPSSDAAACALDQATWEADLATETVVISGTAAKTLGLDDAAPVPLKRFLSAFHRDDRNTILHGLRAAADEALPFTLHARKAGRQKANEPRNYLLSGATNRSVDQAEKTVRGSITREPRSGSSTDTAGARQATG